MPNFTPKQIEFLEGVRQLVEALNPAFAGLPMPPGTRPVGSPGGHWKTRQTKVVRFVPPGEILTQYGTDWFRERPEFYPPKVDIEVSMMRGKHDVTFAAFRVTRKGPKPKATVRYFRTDDLWVEGLLRGALTFGARRRRGGGGGGQATSAEGADHVLHVAIWLSVPRTHHWPWLSLVPWVGLLR